MDVTEHCAALIDTLLSERSALAQEIQHAQQSKELSCRSTTLMMVWLDTQLEIIEEF